MKFAEIGEFLNISESTARLLAEGGHLPGEPSEDGWATTPGDVECWYVKLSARQWAELVADGRVSPIEATSEVRPGCSLADVLSLLESWEERHIVQIISRPSRFGEDDRILMMLKHGLENGLCLPDHEHRSAAEAARRDIETVFQCDRVLGRSEVAVRLSKGRKLSLWIEDKMADLPERDREIIRFRLACYANCLASEVRAQH